MTVQRLFHCDLCRDQHELRDLIGLRWTGNHEFVETAPRDVEHHLCFSCLSGLQALPQRCSEGFNCPGGPKCDGDHK